MVFGMVWRHGIMQKKFQVISHQQQPRKRRFTFPHYYRLKTKRRVLNKVGKPLNRKYYGPVFNDYLPAHKYAMKNCAVFNVQTVFLGDTK